MRHWIGLTAVVLFAACPALANAQETYTLRLSKSKPGATTTMERLESQDDATKVTDNTGKVLQAKGKKEVSTLVFEETTIEKAKDARKADKLKRVYAKAESATDDAKEDLALQGKTVLIEKKDGTYRFTYEGGGEVTGKGADVLTKEFIKKEADELDEKMEKIMMPTKAVKVGETWKPDLGELAKAFTSKEKDVVFKFNLDKSTAQGKLVKAYKKDGKQFGVVEFKIDLVFTSLEAGKTPPIGFQAGAKLALDFIYDGCIDDSVDTYVGTQRMQMIGAGQLPADNPQFRVDMNVTIARTEKSTQKSK